jgi:DNA-binding beta-propeller fold protein YncE
MERARRAGSDAWFLLALGLALPASAAGASAAAAIVPLGEFGEGEGDQAGLLDQPTGVAVDPAGRVYVAERARVSVFSPEGEFLRAFGKDVVPGNDETGFEQCTASCKKGEVGEGAGEFNTIHNLAVDAAGNVYVSEVFNLRVSVFSPEPELEFQHAFGEVVPSDSQNSAIRVELAGRR